MTINVATTINAGIDLTEVEGAVLNNEEAQLVLAYYEKLRANRANIKNSLYFTTLDEYTFLTVAQRKDGSYFIQRGYFTHPLAGTFFDLTAQEAKWLSTALKGETFKAVFLENYLEYYAGLELYGRREKGTLHN